MSKLSKGLKKAGRWLGGDNPITGGAKKIWKKGEKFISNAIPHQHSADRRAANQAAAEQIDFYQKEKAELEKESMRIEDERKQQQDKLSRKQISSARHAYRSPGFMDEESSGYSDTLG